MKNFLFALFVIWAQVLQADNQTATLDIPIPETDLPFTIQIDQASFSLPTGLQSFASGIYKDLWVILAGRTNGLHGFDNIGNNFPPNFQNTTVFVIDPSTGASYSRSLLDGSGLSQSVIDTLSVVASQPFQKGRSLYIVGGYGINTATGEMETKNTLTEIDLKRTIRWVLHEESSLKKAVRQTKNPLLQVTGGFLFQNSDHDPFLLMLGQNFVGLYRDGSNGAYTQQIRPFWLVDEKEQFAILPHPSSKTFSDYRRRDLNIVPVYRNDKPAYIALAGVFTLTDGVWTVPITIFPDGSSFEPDPNKVSSFKQAMNHYNCPAFSLYSTKHKETYIVLPGGISYGYFSNGIFTTDSEFPFINQVTTIKIDALDQYTQYIMDGEYPTIPVPETDPVEPLLFGAEAIFFPAADIHLYHNGTIRLDKIKKPTVIGYIAGGIMSKVPNTTSNSDSTASPYIFTVTLIPK